MLKTGVDMSQIILHSFLRSWLKNSVPRLNYIIVKFWFLLCIVSDFTFIKLITYMFYRFLSGGTSGSMVHLSLNKYRWTTSVHGLVEGKTMLQRTPPQIQTTTTTSKVFQVSCNLFELLHWFVYRRNINAIGVRGTSLVKCKDCCAVPGSDQVHVLILGLKYKFSCICTCTWSLKIQWYLYLDPNYLKNTKYIQVQTSTLYLMKSYTLYIIGSSKLCDDAIG